MRNDLKVARVVFVQSDLALDVAQHGKRINGLWVLCLQGNNTNEQYHRDKTIAGEKKD